MSGGFLFRENTIPYERKQDRTSDCQTGHYWAAVIAIGQLCDICMPKLVLYYNARRQPYRQTILSYTLGVIFTGNLKKQIIKYKSYAINPSIMTHKQCFMSQNLHVSVTNGYALLT